MGNLVFRRSVRLHSARYIRKLKGGSILQDPFAIDILEPSELEKAELEASTGDRSKRAFRLFMAARSRFAEDLVRKAVERSVRQVVVLGAGLDTFSLRNPYACLGVRVFEVDHPETQSSKLARIARLVSPSKAKAHFVSVDFESQNLGQELTHARFDPQAPAFFMWLGGVPYLSEDSVWETLKYISNISQSEVVFDYSEPLENYEPKRQANMIAMAKRLADLGEPWLCHFDPPTLKTNFNALGLSKSRTLT